MTRTKPILLSFRELSLSSNLALNRPNMNVRPLGSDNIMNTLTLVSKTAECLLITTCQGILLQSKSLTLASGVVYMGLRK